MRGQTAHRLLARRAKFVADGHVAGTLLDLGGFPGIVAGRGRVRGEVWRLDPLNAPEVLRTLDEYEGYNFERRATVATLASGRRVRVLVYRYRTRAQLAGRSAARERRSTLVKQMVVIPEGDWRRHRCR